MGFQNLIKTSYYPSETQQKPLAGVKDIDYDYSVKVKISGKRSILTITTKLIYQNKEYIRKAYCAAGTEDIDSCVRANLIKHMKKMGISQKDIPEIIHKAN